MPPRWWPVTKDPAHRAPRYHQTGSAAERAEREQNSRFEMLNALLSSTPLAIARVRGGKIRMAECANAAMLGYAEGELVR